MALVASVLHRSSISDVDFHVSSLVGIVAEICLGVAN